MGKTTILKLFSKEYDNLISLNLEQRNNKELFEKNYKVENLLTVIYLLKDQRDTQYFTGISGQNSKIDIQISKTINSLYPKFQQIFLKYTSSQPKY